METAVGVDLTTSAAATSTAPPPGPVVGASAEVRPSSYFVTVGDVRIDDYLDVLDRVGDPVPTADGRPAHVHLAELLASGVVPTGPLVVAHPDAWTLGAQAVVGEELSRLMADPVRLVRASEAVSAWATEQHPTTGGGSGTLVVEISPRRSTVTLRHHAAAPSRVHVRTGTQVTGELLEHATLRHVLDGTPGLDRSLLRSPALDAPLRRLREDCARAVHDLAEDTETAVPVDLPGILTVVRLVRAEVEALLAPGVRALADHALDLLDATGLAPADLDHVVVTGVLPAGLVAEQLSAALGVAVRSEPAPGAAAAGGAALLAGALRAAPGQGAAGPLPLALAGAEPGESPRPVFARPAPRAPSTRRRDRVASRLLVTAVVVSAVSLGAVQLSHRGDTTPSRPSTSATSGSQDQRTAGRTAPGDPSAGSTGGVDGAGSAALKLPAVGAATSSVSPTSTSPATQPTTAAGPAAPPQPAASRPVPAAPGGSGAGGSAGAGTGSGSGGTSGGGTSGGGTSGGTSGGGTSGGGTSSGTGGGGAVAPSPVVETPAPVVTTPPADPPAPTEDPAPAVAGDAVP